MKKPTFSIIYFPGLISLVFLPLLVVSIYLYRVKLEARWGIQIAWADDDNIKSFNKYALSQIKISDYKDFPIITMAGNKQGNTKALHQLSLRVTQLIKKHESGSGVAVLFKDNAVYSDLVDVLDLGLSFDNKIQFVPYNDKVYFIQLPLNKHSANVKEEAPVFFICGNAIWGERQTRIARSKALFNYTAKSFWPILIPFSLMIFFAFRKKQLQTAHR